MPTITVYDARGKEVILQATGRNGMYERINADGKGTGSLVNLKTALQCNSLFTKEQHKKYLAKKTKRQGK